MHSEKRDCHFTCFRVSSTSSASLAFRHVPHHLWHGKNYTDLLSQTDLFIYLSVWHWILWVWQMICPGTVHCKQLSTNAHNHLHAVHVSTQYDQCFSSILLCTSLTPLMHLAHIDYTHRQTFKCSWTLLYIFASVCVVLNCAQPTDPDSYIKKPMKVWDYHHLLDAFYIVETHLAVCISTVCCGVALS